MKTVTLVYTICALCAGVALATLIPYVRSFDSSVITVILTIFGVCWVSYRIVTKNSLLVLVLLFAFTLGVLLTGNAFAVLDHKELSLRPMLNGVVDISGVIINEPDIREGKQFLVIRTHALFDNPNLSTAMRITTSRHLDFEYGDNLYLRGRVKKPDAFETESGRTFRYDNYLLHKKITHTMFLPEILQHAPGNPSLVRGLLRVKQWFIQQIETTLPHPEAGLLQGLLLGVRAIPDVLYDDFRRTGIVHIVVLSGYNVMLVANFVASLLKRRARWIQFGGIILSLLGFMIITGMQTTVIRATIMGGLAATGRILGSEYSITKSLAIAAGIMIIINPLTLMYDISFQLSFLATIGLVYVGPLIERFFQWVPELLEMRENMIATVSTSLFVMPLIAFAIGDLSIVSPITNLIILPFVAPAMALGFVMSLASILGPVAWIPAVPTYICLWIIIHTATVLGSLEWVSVVLPVIPGWALTVVYGFLFALVIWYHTRSGSNEQPGPGPSTQR